MAPVQRKRVYPAKNLVKNDKQTKRSSSETKKNILESYKTVTNDILEVIKGRGVVPINVLALDRRSYYSSWQRVQILQELHRKGEINLKRRNTAWFVCEFSDLHLVESFSSCQFVFNKICFILNNP
jgi:hypothetical protein